MIRGCELQVDKVWKFVFEASFSWPSQHPIHPFCFVSKLNGAFDNYSPSKRLFLQNSTPNLVEKISPYSVEHPNRVGIQLFQPERFCLIQFVGFTFFFAFWRKKVSLHSSSQYDFLNFSTDWKFLNSKVEGWCLWHFWDVWNNKLMRKPLSSVFFETYSNRLWENSQFVYIRQWEVIFVKSNATWLWYRSRPSFMRRCVILHDETTSISEMVKFVSEKKR